MNDDARIQKLLDTDPLAEAEKRTGESYKDSPLTVGLGMIMHLDHNEKKRDALEETGDVHYSSSFSDQVVLFLELGFETVLVEVFDGRSHDGEPAPRETYMVLWHPEGVLATCETYMNTSCNTAAIHYNVKFKPEVMGNRFRFTSSGRWADHDNRIWSGDHDAREALRHNFTRLQEAGEFLPIWVDQPYLKILSYMDWDLVAKFEKTEFDYHKRKEFTDSLKNARLAKLPQYVRTAIGFEL